MSAISSNKAESTAGRLAPDDGNDQGSQVLCSPFLGLEVRLFRNGKYRACLLKTSRWSPDYPSATAAVIDGLTWLQGETENPLTH